MGDDPTMTEGRSLLDDFRSAILFITILPAGGSVPFSPRGMIRCFPLVGMVLGLMLALGDRIFSLVFPGAVTAVLDTVLLVVLTGALHLDGLGDTADGMFSHRSRERALEIMKDSRTGMMGLVAVVCVLAVKTAGLMALKQTLSPSQAFAALVAVPALARSGMLFGIRYLRYGRDSKGTGFDLFTRPLPWREFAWVGLPVVLTLFLGGRGLLVLAGFGAWVTLLLVFYKRKMNCITGDMLGAMTEVTEAALFLTAGMGFL